MNEAWSDRTREYLSLPEVVPIYDKFKSEFTRRFPTLDFNSLVFDFLPDGRLAIIKSNTESTNTAIDSLINEIKFPLVNYYKPFSLSDDITFFGHELNESQIINEIEENYRNLFKPYELKSHFNVLVSSLKENGFNSANNRMQSECMYYLEFRKNSQLPASVIDDIRNKVPNLKFVDIFSI